MKYIYVYMYTHTDTYGVLGIFRFRAYLSQASVSIVTPFKKVNLVINKIYNMPTIRYLLFIAKSLQYK